MFRHIKRMYGALKGTPLGSEDKKREIIRNQHELHSCTLAVDASDPNSLGRQSALNKLLNCAKRAFPDDPSFTLPRVFSAAKDAKPFPKLQQRAFADILEYTTDDNLKNAAGKMSDFSYNLYFYYSCYDAWSYIAQNAPANSPEKLEAQKRIEIYDPKLKAGKDTPVRHIVTDCVKDARPAPL